MKSFFSSLLGATLFVILLFFPGLVFEGAKMGLNLWFSRKRWASSAAMQPVAAEVTA